MKCSVIACVTAILLPVICLGQTGAEQPPDSVSQMPDSAARAAAVSDTSRTSPLYWYNLENRRLTPADTSRYSMYTRRDEKSHNYSSSIDIFRRHSTWFIYYFGETGRPSYLSFLNTYPHQMSVFYNGIPMNDPVHGMFNFQLFPLNFIQQVESGLGPGAARNLNAAGPAAVQMTSAGLHMPDPMTRIVYKQGRFGESYLDITFAKAFSEKFALNLGGERRLYDGTVFNADLEIDNLRTEFTWLVNPHLYVRGQIFLNRYTSGMSPFEDTGQFPVQPRLSEQRDDFLLDFTWQPGSDPDQSVHVLLYNSFSRREIRETDAADPNYLIRSLHSRYGLEAAYSLSRDGWQGSAGSRLRLTVINGTQFDRTYEPFQGQLYFQAGGPVLENVDLSAGAAMNIHQDYNLSFNGTIRLGTRISRKDSLRLSVMRSTRFPAANERYFNFDGLFGNADLAVEGHSVLSTGWIRDWGSAGFTELTGGYYRLENEVLWDAGTFTSGDLRDFIFLTARTGFAFWKLDFSAGGQYTIADMHVTSRSGVWGMAHFHDIWLKGALVIDLYGMASLFDEHRTLNWEPRLDRFYSGSGKTDPYYTLGWKAVATIETARLFFEMDNATAERIEIISGYPDFYIRWRFGVNWLLWD